MGNKNDSPTKESRLVYSNGDEYIGNSFQLGQIVEGQREGNGEYRWKNKDRYKGQWKSNMKHGEGTFCYRNGEIYLGTW